MVILGGSGSRGDAGRAAGGRCRGVAAVADLDRPWEAGDALRDRAMIPYTDDDSAWALDEAVLSLVRLRAPSWLGDAGPRVSVLVSLAGEAESLLFDAVADARDQGYTWDQVASRLATTAGTACRRYAAYVRWAARPVSRPTPTERSGSDGPGSAGGFRAERAISPVDGGEVWVVVDAELVLHREATDFLACLVGASRSPNTVRVYAGRVAVFLGWCQAEGVDWRTVSLSELARFKHWLEVTPTRGRHRSGSTVNAVLTAVCELLRFCARNGLVESSVAERLSQPKWLRFVPPGFDVGESGQFRLVRAPVLQARAETAFPEALTAEQSRAVLAGCRRPRERFVVVLLRDSGLRIGEALGLRREDMHLLPDSRSLGCAVLGAHVHVRHRANPNGALTKSRFPRMVPASNDIVGAYGDYQAERAAIVGDDGNDMVLVNLYHQPLGAAMSYRAVKDFFDRLARACGFVVRPHMLRHTAATNWVRAGVPLDVVQKLLGHASLSSTTVYLHARDEDRRRAVNTVAEGKKWQ